MKNFILNRLKTFKKDGTSTLPLKEKKIHRFRVGILILMTNLIIYFLCVSFSPPPKDKIGERSGFASLYLPLTHYLPHETKEALVSLFDEDKKIVLAKIWLFPQQKVMAPLGDASQGEKEHYLVQVPLTDLPHLVRLPKTALLYAYPYHPIKISLPRKSYEITF
ncbi:MAG: hypothetical protein KBD63_07825 [Bacteriovoracaceae bacterium]|nr:hypothetical protein [Bacteriovoracaceae bacterium]